MAKRGRPPESSVKRNIGFRVRLKSISKEIRDLVQRRLKEQEEEREDRRKQRAAWYAERGYPEPDN